MHPTLEGVRRMVHRRASGSAARIPNRVLRRMIHRRASGSAARIPNRVLMVTTLVPIAIHHCLFTSFL
jgi:hypothetical protein